MENYIEKVEKMFGLELYEEFEVNNWSSKYRFSENGLQWYDFDNKKWENVEECVLNELLIGTSEIVRKPWIPKDGDDYFTFVDGFEIQKFQCHYDISDAESILLKNCFKTKEEAEAHKDDIKEQCCIAFGFRS